MREYRLLIILFCATLVMISMGWPATWPIAAGAAAMFYGFYRWVWVELLGWFSVILAVLAFAMLISVFHPFSAMLLFLVSLLGCLVFVGWEGAVVLRESWRDWRNWRERRKGSAAGGKETKG